MPNRESMQLVVWAQALDARSVLPPGSMTFWLGAFDSPTAPDLTRLAVTVDGRPAALIGPPVAFRPLRDGSGRNWHTRLIVAGPAAHPAAHGGLLAQRSIRFRLGEAEAECASLPLPTRVPEFGEGVFRILLSSCYSAPQDAGRRLSARVRGLPRPDLVVLAGDQVYLDLPVTEDLPGKESALRAVLGAKYQRNFAALPDWWSSGLAELLAAGPVVCLADDHEFWNNYPYSQAHLPDTWQEAGRRRWERVARDLYADYQCSDEQIATRAIRLDVAPLRLLFVDLRSQRSEAHGKDDECLFDSESRQVFEAWVEALIEDRGAGRPAVGLLSSGQILFQKTPGWFDREFVDAEMPNYRDFERIHAALHRLAEAGVPVLYISGDVHWGRVARAVQTARPELPPLIEVIASPSVQIPGGRHATPDKPRTFGPASARNRYTVSRTFPAIDGMALGNHVAMLEFTVRGGRLSLDVTVYPVPGDGFPSAPMSATRNPIDLGPPRSLTP
jgi:hypothetical protein